MNRPKPSIFDLLYDLSLYDKGVRSIESVTISTIRMEVGGKEYDVLHIDDPKDTFYAPFQFMTDDGMKRDAWDLDDVNSQIWEVQAWLQLREIRWE